MVYQISKEFQFSSSHILEGLPDGHPCGRLHGHNYRVEVILKSNTLNEVGFIRDYGELSSFGEYLNRVFDHRHLNDVLTVQPSAENLAAHFYQYCVEHWPEVCAVRVSETPKTWAEYHE